MSTTTNVVEKTVRDNLPESFFRWKLHNTNGFKSTVVIDAENIALASSERKNSCYWTELLVLRTQKGRIICAELGRTTVDGGEDRCKTYVVDRLDALPSVLGYGRLARRLYNELELEEIYLD